MKSSQTISIIFLLFSLNQVSAQYGNGYGNNYGNNYGGGRMSQNDQMQDTPSKPKEIPVDETVAEIMKKIKPELKLDDLQEIAISHVIKESIRSQALITKDEKTGQEQKMKEIEALSENTTRKINEFLNPDQKELYKNWGERKNGSKKRK